MENHDAMNQSNMMNYLGMMNSVLNKTMMPQPMMQQPMMMPQQMMNQPMMTQPVMAQPMMNQPAAVQPTRMTYPELYYKLQPHVMMMCDQMDTYGMMPTQETVEQMTDHIYNDVNRLHPELAGYVEKKADPNEVKETVALPFGMYDHGRDRGYSFRRRGPFRDLIEILLLQELFNRRRRHY